MRVFEGFCRLVVGLDVEDRVCLKSVPFVYYCVLAYFGSLHKVNKVCRILNVGFLPLSNWLEQSIHKGNC